MRRWSSTDHCYAPSLLLLPSALALCVRSPQVVRDIAQYEEWLRELNVSVEANSKQLVTIYKAEKKASVASCFLPSPLPLPVE